MFLKINSMKTDIEIARETPLLKIQEVAERYGINPEVLQPYGAYIAKVPIDQIDEKKIKKHHLILVTAITPTKAGNSSGASGNSAAAAHKCGVNT